MVLTKKEELNLIDHLKNFGPADEARKQILEIILVKDIKLIMKHINEALNQFGLQYIRSHDYEDLINESALTYIKNIDNFDPKKGIRLASYMRQVPRQCILRNMALLKDVPRQQESDVYQEDDMPVKSINRNRIRHLLEETLTEKEYTVINLRFGLNDGESRYFTEMCDLFGQTEANMRKIYKAAMVKLREIEELKFFYEENYEET